MDDTKIIELFWQRSGDAIDETDKKYGRMCRRLAGNILGDARDPRIWPSGRASPPSGPRASRRFGPL